MSTTPKENEEQRDSVHTVYEFDSVHWNGNYRFLSQDPLTDSVRMLHLSPKDFFKLGEPTQVLMILVKMEGDHASTFTAAT